MVTLIRPVEPAWPLKCYQAQNSVILGRTTVMKCYQAQNSVILGRTTVMMALDLDERWS